METPSEFDNPTTNDATDSLIRVSGMYEDWFLDYASYVILERAVPVSYTHLRAHET